jgi:hypothetical protein
MQLRFFTHFDKGHDSLSIKVNTQKPVIKLEILNHEGMVVFYMDYPTNNITVDISHFLIGSYFIRIGNGISERIERMSIC